MKVVAHTLAGLGLCLASAGLLAQTPQVSEAGQPATPDTALAASPADAATICEIHAWPAKGFHTVQYGWTHGGTIDGSQKGRKGYPDMPDEPLSPAIQRAELAKLDLGTILGLENYKTVIHDEPLDTPVIRSTAGRHAAQSGSCYAELIVEDIVYQNNVLSGKWLNVIFRFRQFEGAGDTPSKTYSTYITTRLSKFPGEPGGDPAPALEELRNAFGQSAVELGKQYAAFNKRGGKRKPAKITL